MTVAQESNSVQQQAGKIREHLYGFVNVYLLNADLELGLFEELRKAGAAGMSVEELAQRRGLYEPYLSVWCRCAYGCGYLDVTADDRLCLASHMETILADAHHPAYLGTILRLFATYCTFDLLEHTEYLQTGEVFPVQAHGEGFAKLLAKHGTTKGVKFLELVVPRVPGLAAKLQHGATVLDSGCGGGTFMIALARVYPRCTFVGIDSDPYSVQVADGEIAWAGLSERVYVQHASAEAIEFANAFDITTMNSVLREVPSHLAPQVMARCFTALKPGGVLVITDFSLPDSLCDLRDPAYRAALMDLFLEMTWGRHHQTRQEQIALLTRAGFVNVHHRSLSDNVYALLYGEKPQG